MSEENEKVSEDAKSNEGPLESALTNRLLGCFVLASAVFAFGILLGAAFLLTSIAADRADEKDRHELRVEVVNRCSRYARAGWLLSDSAVPFTSSDFERFFPPISVNTADAELLTTENQTRFILPGSSAQLGLGRIESSERERILLVQAVEPSSRPPGAGGTPRDSAGSIDDSVKAYLFTPSSVATRDAIEPIVLLGDDCHVEGMRPYLSR